MFFFFKFDIQQFHGKMKMQIPTHDKNGEEMIVVMRFVEKHNSLPNSFVQINIQICKLRDGVE